jgi:hypothetical protein
LLGTARRGKNANADLPRLIPSGGRHSGVFSSMAGSVFDLCSIGIGP